MNGMWAKTDSGIFQIDGSSPAWCCKYHNTLTTASGQLPVEGSNFGRIYKISTAIVTWTFPAEQPVIAVYAPDRPVTMITCKNNGDGTWTALFWSQGGTTSFEAYVFDRLGAFWSGSNIGFKVWDTAHNLLYDAQQPPMIPIGFVSGVAGNFSWGWQGSGPWPRGFTNDYSQPGVGKIAVAAIVTGQSTSDISSNNTDGSSSSGYMSISCWYTNGSTCQMRWTDNVFGSPAGSYPNTFVGYGSQLYWGGLLIDVTNIA